MLPPPPRALSYIKSTEPRELADSLSSCTPLKKKGKEKEAGPWLRARGVVGLKATEKSVLFGRRERGAGDGCAMEALKKPRSPPGQICGNEIMVEGAKRQRTQGRSKREEKGALAGVLKGSRTGGHWRMAQFLPVYNTDAKVHLGNEADGQTLAQSAGASVQSQSVAHRFESPARRSFKAHCAQLFHTRFQMQQCIRSSPSFGPAQSVLLLLGQTPAPPQDPN